MEQTKTTKKERMYQRINNHGHNLNEIFNTEYDNVTLCKKLRTLENKAYQISLKHTNYGMSEEELENEEESITKKIIKILGEKARECFILNLDARGYALKLKDSFVNSHCSHMFKDWGGYGILAPDFSNE